MTRLDKLWRAVDGPGTPPQVDGRRVRARVNAVLDAECPERNIGMKQRFCTALLVAAVILAVTGTALAATVHWDALSAWFKGDNAPGLMYLSSEARTVSDENYTLTVESAAADKTNVYLTVSITARSSAAKEFLYSDDFISMDMLWARFTPPDAAEEFDAGGFYVIGMASRELKSGEPDCRRFALDARLNRALSSGTLFVTCGYMEEGIGVEVPFTAAPEVSVKIGASGQGVENYRFRSDHSSNRMVLHEIILSPFTCRMRMSLSNVDISPRILLRMQDGTILTQAQMMEFTDSCGAYEASYRFHEVQDLESIRSVIVFDREYPLDGSASTPVEHDPALDPFTVTRMEPLSKGSGYSLPVRELTEKLGGTFRQNTAGDEAVCTYRDTEIVLQAGSRTAQVNGQSVELRDAPAMQDGVLAAPYSVFKDAWGIDACVQREDGERINEHEMELIWHDWYVIP